MSTARQLLPMSLLLAACGSTAQTPPAAGPKSPTAAPKLTVEKVAPGVAVIFGQGGNIGVSYGADGTVLIDDQFAPVTSAIQAAITDLGATPVKFLISTHWHSDHTGGNENFGKAGAIIMAHDNVRLRLAKGGTAGGQATPPAPAVALPVITYADGLKLHLNGDELRTQFLEHGHTDGDSIVVWRAANVVHMGDLFFNKVTLPFIDLDSGGSARGMLAAVDRVLPTINDRTVVIPGHGPVSNKAGLMTYRAMLAEIIGSVERGIRAKQSLAQIKAAKPAAKYEVKGGFISGDAFVETVYTSLTVPLPHHG